MKCLECFLDLIQWETVCDQRSDIDPAFADPSHGQREIASKVGVDTGMHRQILKKQIAPAYFDGFRRNTEIQDPSGVPAEINAEVELLVVVTDGFNHDFRQLSVEDVPHGLDGIISLITDSFRGTKGRTLSEPGFQQIDADDVSRTEISQGQVEQLTHRSLANNHALLGGWP